MIKNLKFIYDPMDMRVAKIEYVNGCDELTTTYYTYDASEEKALLSKTECLIGKISSTWEEALLSKTEGKKLENQWNKSFLFFLKNVYFSRYVNCV